MATIREILGVPRQRLAQRSLRKDAKKKYADDPDVVFHNRLEADENAPHGVNTPSEMEFGKDDD